MTTLVKYEAACRAVADAVSIDEAKEFRDQSEAMRAYAKQAKNKQLEVQAAEIRIRAERRIGELMAAQRDGGHMATAGRPSEKIGSQTDPISKAPTLAEAGIDKHLADRARKYAAIPENEFNGIVGNWKDRVEGQNARVTVNLLNAGKKGSKAASEQPNPDPYGYSKLTEEALLETANGLRADLEGEKARRKNAEKTVKDQALHIKELTSADDAGRKIGSLQRRLQQSEGRSREHQAARARLQRQVNAQTAEIKKLRKSLAGQDFTL